MKARLAKTIKIKRDRIRFEKDYKLPGDRAPENGFSIYETLYDEEFSTVVAVDLVPDPEGEDYLLITLGAYFLVADIGDHAKIILLNKIRENGWEQMGMVDVEINSDFL